MHQPSPQASIIIIADTLFYPPRRNGFSVRYYPLVLELSNIGYQVDIIVTNKYKENYTNDDITELRRICKEIDIISTDITQQSLPKRLARRINNFFHKILPFGIPYQLIDNNRQYNQNHIQKLLSKRKVYDFAIGVGVGGLNADILLSLSENIKPHKIICDFVDSAYLLLKRSHNTIAKRPTPLTRLELIKTRRWEKSFCKRCNCIYISNKDARTVGSDNAHIIPNCVVEDGFDKFSIINMDSPNIAFLGNMSYPPNIAACSYLITKLLPSIRKRIPDIHIYIVGRNPSVEVLSYGTIKNIHITGEVKNIWDYVHAADAFVFPMLTGAGLQNKVLEAMYAGKPVVTSPIGNEGIGAKDGRDILIANDKSEFINLIEEAVFRGDQIGSNARKYVQKHFSSRSLANSFDKLFHE